MPWSVSFMIVQLGIDLFVICTEMQSWLWKINPPVSNFSKILPVQSVLVEFAFLQLCSIYKRVRIRLKTVKDLSSAFCPHEMKPCFSLWTRVEHFFASLIFNLCFFIKKKKWGNSDVYMENTQKLENIPLRLARNLSDLSFFHFCQLSSLNNFNYIFFAQYL